MSETKMCKSQGTDGISTEFYKNMCFEYVSESNYVTVTKFHSKQISLHDTCKKW